MPQPSPDVDLLFEDLLQDLPPETAQMAREFKAFTRSRKSKTPVQLLRVVLLYCRLDTSLREVAGHVTLLGERITDTSVAERLATWWRPWKLLQKELSMSPANRYPKQHAKARQHHRLKAHERLERDRRQAQRAAEAL
jgi:hypothetical protein